MNKYDEALKELNEFENMLGLRLDKVHKALEILWLLAPRVKHYFEWGEGQTKEQFKDEMLSLVERYFEEERKWVII